MDDIKKKIDAAYNKHGNEYIFISRENSYLPYAEGFKDGYNLAMQEMSEFKLNNDKPKNAGKWIEEIKEINIDPKKQYQ